MNPRLRDQEAPGFGDENDRDTPKTGMNAQEASPRRRRNRYRTARRNRTRHAVAASAAAPEESRPAEPEVAAFEGEASASRPSREAGEGRSGHLEESPRTWAAFVTITALVFLALIIWIVVF